MKVINPMSEIPQRPVVIVLFGEPGSRKTSVANTAKKSMLLDFDRGFDRSINWENVVLIEQWEDAQEYIKNGEFQKWDTTIIDTAKAALDDFAAQYVIKVDPKNKKAAGGLALSGYGAIADEFKISLLEPLRQSGKNLIIIAHSKDDKDNDQTMKIPDVTGQTQSLLIRIADQVGYVGIKNGRSVIEFKPSDRHIGKDTAGITEIEIPDSSSPEWNGFMDRIISTVKEKIRSKTIQKQEAERTISQFRKSFEDINTPEDANKLIEPMSSLPEYLKLTLKKELSDVTKAKGFSFDKETKKFIIAPDQKKTDDQPEPESDDKQSESTEQTTADENAAVGPDLFSQGKTTDDDKSEKKSAAGRKAGAAKK